MNLSIALYLGQDGIANGAVYALLAIAIVVIFSVTRIIFVPQGEFISYSALTFAALQDGQTPGTVGLLGILLAAHALVDVVSGYRSGAGKIIPVLASVSRSMALPVTILFAAYFASKMDLPLAIRALVAIAIVGAAGPSIYRLVYQPIADASILLLLIVSVALHFVMTGIALYIFGPSGMRSAPLVDFTSSIAGTPISGQTILIVVVAVLLVIVLYIASGKTLYGKAMTAASVNRRGARLMGISVQLTGRIAFLLAAVIGAISGVLIAPTTTILYDTGFILGLKGFVGAILGGMVSYPVSGLGALLIGLLESYSAFFASAYKEVIVFSLVIPILLVRSLLQHRGSGEEEVEAIPVYAQPSLTEQQLRRRRAISNGLKGMTLASLVAAPLLLSDYQVALLNYVGLASIVVLGLVLLTGVAGLTSFAQAAYLGIGAYITGYCSTAFGASPWQTLPLVLSIAALLAYLGSLITVRLSGHYLPLATLALAIVAYYLFGNLEFIGGQSGMSNIPPLTFFGIDMSGPKSIYVVIWVVMLLLLVGMRNLLDSRSGRAIRSLRYGSVMAESVAINTHHTKIVSFLIACLLAAFAGWLYAHTQRFINPSPFSFNQGIAYLFMAVIGGVSSLIGAVVGSGLVVLSNQWLQTNLPNILGVQGDFEAVVFGIVAIIIMQWLPVGIWPAIVAACRMQVPKEFEIPSDAPILAERRKPERGSEVLSAQGIYQVFGAVVANKGIDLSVRAGEILALIGPNGAGKSTLFDIISGVRRPTSGTVTFLNQASAYSSRALSLAGMGRTFQHTRIISDMTVLENAAIGAHARGRGNVLRATLRADRSEEVKLLSEASRQLQRLGLSQFASRNAGSLALGQQRILEIARALCSDPCILLLDEPAAGLRHLEKKTLADVLRQLKAEGMTIVIVEHDMDFVMSIADRVVVMQFGEKLAEGPPAEIQRNPAVIEAYLGGAE